jgi:glutamine amidotransferase
VRRLHPHNPRFTHLSSDDRLIVSEPFSDLPGVWREIPQGTAVTVRRGGVLEERPFRPQSLAAGAERTELSAVIDV